MQNPSDGKSALGLDPNVAAGLAYLPVCWIHLILSIIILATDKTNKLPRFHAVQSLLLTGAAIAGGIVCWVAWIVILFGAIAIRLPFLALFGYLIFLVYGLAILAAVIFCLIKAFQGQIFKLPIIGNMADNWSN
jgi:uncharacterized membrane protein